jgi:peptidyl-tRNA hydrolase PTH2
VVCRDDLPRGFQAAQICHAAGESSPGNLPAGTNAVVLAVPNEAALHALAERLRSAGVDFVPVYEPDPPWNGQLTAIGFRPTRREVLRRYLSSLPKLK